MGLTLYVCRGREMRGREWRLSHPEHERCRILGAVTNPGDEAKIEIQHCLDCERMIERDRGAHG